MTRKDAKRILLAGAFMMGLTSLACESATEPVHLGIMRIHGTVTSSLDNAPIVDMGVVLASQFASFGGGGYSTTWGTTDAQGKYMIIKETTVIGGPETFLCTPDTFEIGFAIPDGYRLVPGRDYGFAVQCIEEVQVFDFQLEPF